MTSSSNQPLRGYNLTTEHSSFDFKQRKDKPAWLKKVEEIENEYGSLNELSMNDPRLLEVRKLQDEYAAKNNARKAKKQLKTIQEEWGRENQ